MNLYAPTANTLAAFLADVSEGGNTAAVSVHSSLARLAGWLRLELNLADSLVTGWRASSGDRVPHQQMPLEPVEIFILERAALKSEFWAGAAAPRHGRGRDWGRDAVGGTRGTARR